MPTLLLAAAIGLVPGCAIVYRSQVSTPDTRAVQGRPEFGRNTAAFDRGFVVPVHGAHGGIKVTRGGLKVHLRVLNRQDRAIAFGPWILVPLPLIPVLWNPGTGPEVEGLYGHGVRVDSVIVILVRIAPINESDTRTIAFMPDSVKLTPGDREARRTTRVRLIKARDGNSKAEADVWSFTGWAEFELLVAGGVPVSERFVVDLGEVRIGDDRVALPPIQYGPGTGICMALLTIN